MAWVHPWEKIREQQRVQGSLAEQRLPATAAHKEAVASPNQAKPAAHDELMPYMEAVRQALSVMAPMDDLQERAKHKEHVLKELMPWVDCWVATGAKYPNPVAVRCMIWLFDIGDVERALPLALALIGQKIQRLPEGFDRDMQTFVCDCVYDWASQRLRAAQTASPHLERLIEAMDQENWDLHPVVKGKLYAMAAKHAMRQVESDSNDMDAWSTVARWCKKAEKANPRAGVKTLSEKAQAKLKAV